ncbi:MAG TPA: histidine kinase [Thermoanaerobaculia bacterium]|nr:histidine kinase [Thermoanaerobaculia bacterium]
MMNRRWILAAAFWGVFGLVSGLQLWISMITHGHSVPRLIGYNVIIWEGWLALSVAIGQLTKQLPLIPFKSFNALIHALAAIVVAVLHVSYWIALTLFLRPFDPIPFTWSRMNVGQIFFSRVPVELILYLVVAGIAQAMQLQTSLTNARLHALELQLQPHFLFNTLNTISSLVRTEQNEEAVTMIAGLSDLLRYTLDHAGRQQVTLDEEGAMLRRYLEIQKGRFPDRLTYSIDIDPDVRHAAVPTFILQPLAENAIRHGVARSAGAGVVNVRAFRGERRVHIEMFNSGTLSSSTNGGIGVANTRERLRQLYGNEQKFELRNDVGGVVASLTVPLRELA